MQTLLFNPKRKKRRKKGKRRGRKRSYKRRRNCPAMCNPNGNGNVWVNATNAVGAMVGYGFASHYTHNFTDPYLVKILGPTPTGMRVVGYYGARAGVDVGLGLVSMMLLNAVKKPIDRTKALKGVIHTKSMMFGLATGTVFSVINNIIKAVTGYNKPTSVLAYEAARIATAKQQAPASTMQQQLTSAVAPITTAIPAAIPGVPGMPAIAGTIAEAVGQGEGTQDYVMLDDYVVEGGDDRYMSDYIEM